MNENPNILAVCFDMDGLMFNTEDLYDEVGQILLERRGKQFTSALKLEMMGLPGPVAFEVMRSRCDLPDSVETLQQETDVIFETLLEKIEMMPGLETLLATIESAGLPKAVATSSHRQFAMRALGTFDLLPQFEFVLTGDEVENGKPNPDIYLEAAKRLRVSPESMMVLEDSLHGSRAGAAAKAFTIGVPGRHSREQDYSHCNLRVERLDDAKVLKLIENCRSDT